MKLNICTWNLLNPEPSISFMSWKGWIGNQNVSPYTIASVDYERFVNFRSRAICEILSWMITKSPHPLIICLQEVHPLLIPELKKLVGLNQIGITQETQSNYLVTLITQGYIDGINSLQLDRKIAQISKIKFDKIEYQISCANIHFYWKWSVTQVNTFGQELVSNLDTPFIIAGDFNKPIDMLEEFMGLFDCVLYNTPGVKANISPYTSVLTHINGIKPLAKGTFGALGRNSEGIDIPELGQIDHIMFSSDFIPSNKTQYRILSRLLNYKIFYPFVKIVKLFESKQIDSWVQWVKLDNGSGISDHKPVFVKNIEIY